MYWFKLESLELKEPRTPTQSAKPELASRHRSLSLALVSVPHSPPPWMPHMDPASTCPWLVQVPRPLPQDHVLEDWVGLFHCLIVHAQIPTFAA